MADYTRQHDFSVKDALTTGDPDKVIKGSEVDEELDAVVTANGTKIDVLTGHTTNNIPKLNSVGKLEDSGILATDINTLSGAQTVAGDKTHTGDITASGSSVVTLAADPSNALEAATKQYADAVLEPGTSVTMDPIAAASSATASHGLGAQPTLIEMYIECKTTDNGYAVGDRIRIAGANDGAAGGRGVIAGANTSSVFVATGQFLPKLPPKTGGTDVLITAASWKLIAVPYLTN